MSISLLIGQPPSLGLQSIDTHLKKMGYDLHITRSATDALTLMEETGTNAVLVNIASPEANGIQVCATLRQAREDITIIGINQAEPLLRRAALEAGADIVLDDPVKWVDIKNWLHAPRATNGSILVEGSLFGQTREDNIGSASLLSHDLKSPISIIISSLEVMTLFQEEDGMSEAARKLLEGALHAAYRQFSMVSNVIDLARLEMDVYDLQVSELDMTHIVRDCLESESYALETKGLEVFIDLPDTSIGVIADLELIQRAISAIIDSVIKFTVRGDKFNVSLQREGDEALLRFQDTGRLLRPGFEQDIMTRAPQWDHRQAGERTSVGLSLPFVYAVAMAHKGNFIAESNSNWTTFTMSLPTI